MKRLLLALWLFPGVAFAGGDLPLGWTHTYLDSTWVAPDSVVTMAVEVTFAATAIDSCVLRDTEGECLLEYTNMVSATWSGGVDSGLTTWFRAEDSAIEVVGFRRPGMSGFYSDPLLWVPAPPDQTVGNTWNWSATFPVGSTNPLTFQSTGSILAVDELVFVPLRPLGRPAVRIQHDDAVVARGGLAFDVLGRQTDPQRKAPASNWYTTFNGKICVMIRDERLVLESLVDPGQHPVEVRRSGFGGLKAKYRP